MQLHRHHLLLLHIVLDASCFIARFMLLCLQVGAKDFEALHMLINMMMRPAS